MEQPGAINYHHIVYRFYGEFSHVKVPRKFWDFHAMQLMKDKRVRTSVINHYDIYLMGLLCQHGNCISFEALGAVKKKVDAAELILC